MLIYMYYFFVNYVTDVSGRLILYRVDKQLRSKPAITLLKLLEKQEILHKIIPAVGY